MILVTTINDPYQALLEKIKISAPVLKELYEEIYICISEITSPAVISLCEARFPNIKIIPKRGAADARRKALNYGLIETDSVKCIMYCDFDRILTWLLDSHTELQNLVSDFEKQDFADYTVLGRTPKAFKAHPLAWQETERITNKVAAHYLDFDDLDVTAGGAIMSSWAAETISQRSNYTHTDCEWPYLIKKMGGSLAQKKVNGLTYTEINQARTDKTESEHYVRLKLAYKILGIFAD